MVPEPGSTRRPSSPSSIHGWFRHWTRRQPDALAVRHRGDALTYAELDVVSDHAAARLSSHGAGPGVIVPILLPRSLHLVAALLGVLKTGAAYAVLDPAWPIDRLRSLSSTIGSPVVVGEGVDGLDAVAWHPRSAWETERRPGPPAPFHDSDGSEPCSVFFTSGTSTGVPRGAVVPHAGTVLLFQECGFADLGPGSAMLQAAALPWDGLTLELWSMLTTGGTAILSDHDHGVTGHTIRDAVAHGCSVLWLTCTVFNLLVDEDVGCFAGLGQLMIGGERLSPAHVARFLEAHPGCELTNGYGPAEATVFVTTHAISPDDVHDEHGIPLGRAVNHTRLHVLTDGRPTPPGEVGELVVSGPRVAQGYLGGERSDAFVDVDVDGAPVRAYATGDLVRVEDEKLYFVGRKDRELKIRGHRVEPREIEQAVLALDGVTDCRAVPVRDQDGRVTGVAAFLTGTPPSDGGAAHRAALRASLPNHLVPETLRHVDAFPRTTHGKLDERALLASLSGRHERTSSRAPHPSGGSDPSGGSEVAGSVIEHVMQLVDVTVTVDDRLADVGCTSLDLARLAMRLERRWGCRLRLADLSTSQAVGDVVDRLTEALAALDEEQEPVAAPRNGTEEAVELTPMQTSFMIASIGAPDDTSSLCLLLWDVRGELSPDAMEAALADVQRRHEALGSRYVIRESGIALPPTASDVPAPAPSLRVLEDRNGREAARAAVLTELTRMPWRLDRGEVWRASAHQHDDREVLLALAVHHVAFDGWSESVLASDLSHAYAARLRGEEPRWSHEAPRMAELARERTRRRRHVHDQRDVDYWRDLLAGAPELALDTAHVAACDEPCPPDAHTIVRPLSPEDVEAWREAARRERSSLLALLLSVYERVLSPLVASDLVVGVPFSERESHLEEDAIGCFITMMCCRIDPHASGGRRARAADLHRQLVASSRHRAMSFPDVVRALAPARSGRSPIYQTLFALQDNARPELALPGCAVTFSRPQAPDAPVELLVEVQASPGTDPAVTVSYQCHAVPHEVALTVADSFARVVADGPAA